MKFVLLIVVGAVLVTSWWLSADATLTAYWLNSAGHAVARETFAVEPQSRTVSAIVRTSDGKTQFIEPMKDCAIVDAHNWQCANAETQAVDGLVTAPYHSSTDTSQAVNALHWWAVRSWEALTNDNYGHQLLPSFLTRDWASVTLGYALVLVALYFGMSQLRELIRRLRAPKAAAIPEKRDVRAGWRRAQRA